MSVKLYKDGKLIPISGPLYSSGNFPGQIVMGVNDDAPEGWLLCDGKAYPKTEYQELYKAIGDKFNAPDTPSDKFCVPNQLTADGKPRALYGADNGKYKVGTYIEESLPNIRGNLALKRVGYGDTKENPNGFLGCFEVGKSNKLTQKDSACAGYDRAYVTTPIGFNASKTLNKNGSEQVDDWTTVNNTAYKDGANVFSNGIAVNMFIKY